MSSHPGRLQTSQVKRSHEQENGGSTGLTSRETLLAPIKSILRFKDTAKRDQESKLGLNYSKRSTLHAECGGARTQGGSGLHSEYHNSQNYRDPGETERQRGRQRRRGSGERDFKGNKSLIISHRLALNS